MERNKPYQVTDEGDEQRKLAHFLKGGTERLTVERSPFSSSFAFSSVSLDYSLTLRLCRSTDYGLRRVEATIFFLAQQLPIYLYTPQSELRNESLSVLSAQRLSSCGNEGKLVIGHGRPQ